MAQEQTSASASNTTSTSSRKITVVTTRGTKTTIEFKGTKWSELQSQLQRGGTDANGNSYSGYDLSNMKAVEGLKKTTLEHKDAIVPEQDFALFLMPYKSKSGAKAASKTKTKAKAAPKKAAKAPAKKAAPAKKTATKAAPKKATAKASPKKETVPTVKYADVLKSAKLLSDADQGKLITALGGNNGVGKVVEATAKAKEVSDKDLDQQLNEVMSGLSDVRR